MIEISDKPGEEEAEPAFKVSHLFFLQGHEQTQFFSLLNIDLLG